MLNEDDLRYARPACIGMLGQEWTATFLLRFQWCSHLLTSDPTAPIAEWWISIPPHIWPQGVVPGEHWVVVSLQTAAEHALIEERPVTEGQEAVRQRKYAEESR